MAQDSRDINRYYAHWALFQVATCLAGVFFIPFLLRQGLSPTEVLLAFAAMHALRWAMRRLVVPVVSCIGLRGAMALGATISAVNFLTVPQVHGLDGWLLIWAILSAAGDVLYWTLHHVVFARLGDGGGLGGRVGLRQLMGAAVSVLAPPLGGFLLSWFAPAIAFWVAAAVRLAAAAPLLAMADIPFDLRPPGDGAPHARFGGIVFLTDGWCVGASVLLWGMFSFAGLGGNYGSLGVALAAAGLVGALAGVGLGRLVDKGGGPRAVLANFAGNGLVFALQALIGQSPLQIITVMLLGAVTGGLSSPALATAVYAEARAAPCALRFQIAAEGGWDAGLILGALTASALLALGAPMQSPMLLAIPALALQSWLLTGKYRARAVAAPAE